ncbi:MAG: WD40 repeat domain-containing protein, partial [Nitrosopumilaceae archaeon]
MIIVFVIFSFFSIPIVYGLPIFWGKHVDGKIWSIDISEDGRYMAAGVDLGENKGKVYFIDKNGNLLWSQEEDRIIGKVSLSKDGSFVLASGYQIIGGGGGAAFYANPSVYLFDQSGKLLWNFQNANRTNLTPDNQFLEGTIDPNGNNIVIAADYEILFLNRTGNLLWNHTTDGHLGPVKISDDGSTIAVGIIHYEKDNVWELSVFGNLGNSKWNHIGTDGHIQGNAMAISSDGQNIVIGSMASGEVGNLYKF